MEQNLSAAYLRKVNSLSLHRQICNVENNRLPVLGLAQSTDLQLTSLWHSDAPSQYISVEWRVLPIVQILRQDAENMPGVPQMFYWGYGSLTQGQQ